MRGFGRSFGFLKRTPTSLKTEVMKTRKTLFSSTILSILLAAVLLAGCDGTSDEREATWRDLGLIAGAEELTGVAVAGGYVVVGTGDGVWRRPLDGTGSWTRSGLEGHRVRVLRPAPDAPEKLFAGVDPMGVEGRRSFYRSENGGASWDGGGEGLYDEFLEAYVSVEDVAPKPGTEGQVLFANLQGASVAHSKDGGATWQVVKGSLDEFGYPCLVHLPSAAPSTLYQGCEIPLDVAWIRTYDVAAANPVLGEGELKVGLDDISNRRINSFASFAAAPGVVYAGIEGAVVAMEGDEWRWVWRHDGTEDSTDVNYVYVKYFWVDPADPGHLLIAGGDGDRNEDSRAGLLESFDGGATVTELTGPGGLRFDVGGVRAGTTVGAQGNAARDVVLAALTPQGARVVVRENR